MSEVAKVDPAGDVLAEALGFLTQFQDPAHAYHRISGLLLGTRDRLSRAGEVTERPKADFAGGVLAEALGFLTQFQDPAQAYHRISGLLKGISTCDRMASEDDINNTVTDQYELKCALNSLNMVSSARPEMVDAVTSSAIQWLQVILTEHLLVDPEEVCEAAERIIPPDLPRSA